MTMSMPEAGRPDPAATAPPEQRRTGWRGRLRRRLAGRPDTEHEQALIRIGFAVLIGVYILAASGGAATVLWGGLGISLAALVLSSALFVHILLWPGANPARRIAGMLIDTVGVCGVMLVGGMSAAPFYPILLWIILGHGFRFGRPYLFAAAGTALVLFTGVVLLNPEWRQVPTLDVALILALIVLPAYVSTLLRKLEQAIRRAEEANQAKSRFLAVMSHEFRTPLNAVIGLSDLLRRDEPDEDRREMLGTVRTAAGTILGLVDAVLDVAKIEAGKFAVIDRPFDLHGLLGILRGMLEPQAQARGLRLRLVLDPMVPPALQGDQAALQQVLTNLVANALKFTEQGEVVLRVEARGGNRIRFAVSDTGIGIPLDRQERIFESFTQADDGTNRAYGGTGLGLTIAKELVELMGGRLSLESEPGRGTTFGFELALAAAALDELPPLPSHGSVVVLGEGPVAERAFHALERAGYAAHHVARAEDVMAKLHGRHGRRLLVLAQPGTLHSINELLGIVFHRAGGIDIVAIGDMPPPTLAMAALSPSRLEAELPMLARAALAPLQAPRLAAVQEQVTAAKPGRLLVAEDNLTNQQVVRRILESAGHQVVIVGNGQDAVDRVMEEPFDLVLMDLNMPGMGGIDALKLMRFSVDELPPVVALTADVTEATIEACRAVGFADYAVKPIDTPVLLGLIDRLIDADAREGTEPAHPGEQEVRAVSPVLPAAPPPPPAQPAPPSCTSPRPRNVVTLASAGEPRPVLDRRKLDGLAKLDQDDGFVDEVIDTFLVEAGELVEAMARAVVSGDAAMMRDLAHALRSSAAHVGATALFDVLLGWRSLDDACLLARGPAEVQRLRLEMERVASGLAAWRTERGGARRSGQA